MPWFAAQLVMECVLESGGPTLCDVQTRVIDATDPAAAFEAALGLGAEEESENVNVEGETIQWRFRGLSDLVELSIESIESGSEVWSSLYEATDAQELVTPKARLTAIRLEQHLDTPVKDLLPGRLRPFAPSE